ncbi:hypothetical protein D3C72_1046790 [compost metagenome]
MHRALPEQGHHHLLRYHTHFGYPVIAAEQGTGQGEMAGHRAHHPQRGFARVTIAIRARQEQRHRLHFNRRIRTGLQAGKQAIIVGGPPTASPLIQIEQPSRRQRLQPAQTVHIFIDDPHKDLVDHRAQCGFGHFEVRHHYPVLPSRERPSCRTCMDGASTPAWRRRALSRRIVASFMFRGSHAAPSPSCPDHPRPGLPAAHHGQRGHALPQPAADP